MPERDNPDIVALFVNERKKAGGAPPRLKAKHFKPRPYPAEGGRLELSTYCVDNLDDEARWQLLELHCPTVVGRSELEAEAFRDHDLTVDPDWDPDRHVNIIDWPDDEKDCGDIAQALYDRQAYHPPPGP